MIRFSHLYNLMSKNELYEFAKTLGVKRASYYDKHELVDIILGELGSSKSGTNYKKLSKMIEAKRGELD